jgi:hypothetical protein
MNSLSSNNNLSVADIKNQEIIDNALISAGLPQNKLNGLVSMIKDKLICDSACQKERTAKELKENLDLAQNNLKNAPQDLETAEKNYYLFTKGTSDYDNMVLNRNIKSSKNFKEESIKQHNERMEEIKILKNQYDSDKIYTQRMNQLVKLKLYEENKIKDSIDTYKSKVQTNDRKVVYENKDMDWSENFRFILKIVYYILFIVYFIISDYFSSAKYKNIKLWGVILVYLLFPYTLDWHIKKVFELYNYIYYIFGTLHA